MNILAIETSCDDTAVAILAANQIDDNHAEFSILGNAVNSQIEKHREYGGVYPNLARREHAHNIIPILEIVCHEAGITSEVSEPHFDSTLVKKVEILLEREPELTTSLIQFCWNYRKLVNKIDHIAVTTGPGLAPALWIGINAGQVISILLDIPITPVNHMSGHILSGTFPDYAIKTPALALLVSGGHTEIDQVNSPNDFEIIGKTVDDAVGEAFDKVARLLGLPYPGGPEISRLATEHRNKYPDYTSSYNLPRPMLHSGDLNFSYSGLKTAVKRVIELHDDNTKEFKLSLAREFEDAAIEVIIKKLSIALDNGNYQQLLVGGGVSANTLLREQLAELALRYNIKLLLAPIELTGDNAIMIAMAGFWKLQNDKNIITPEQLQARSSWKVDEVYDFQNSIKEHKLWKLGNIDS